MTTDFFTPKPKTSVAPDYVIDFTTGKGIEKLTFNSPSAGSTGKGKHCLVRTDDGGFAWVPAPAGIHAGWRGIQIVTGLESYPVGWVQLGARKVYHVGGGNGISWQYFNGAPLPDVNFIPSAPARTNYATYSKGIPSATGWTITDAANHPNWSPYGARRFYNNSGYGAGGGVVASWPGGNAHLEAIVEHGGDASDTYALILIRNNTANTSIAGNKIATISGNNISGSGDYRGQTVLTTSGPNGGTVTKFWCGINNPPIGDSIGYNMYPTDSPTNRSTIIHHIEARIGETAVIGPPIFTNGTAETVLAETTTIEDPTIDNGPFTLIVDLTEPVYNRGEVPSVLSFGPNLSVLAIWSSGYAMVGTADDGILVNYSDVLFPSVASRVAVRRPMPGGAMEFYSSETGQFYPMSNGKTYTKTSGTKLLLGTAGHDLIALSYVNRPMKRLQVYKFALTDEEIANA